MSDTVDEKKGRKDSIKLFVFFDQLLLAKGSADPEDLLLDPKMNLTAADPLLEAFLERVVLFGHLSEER